MGILFDRFEGIDHTEEESIRGELENLLATKAFYLWQYGCNSDQGLEEKIVHFEPRASHIFLNSITHHHLDVNEKKKEKWLQK